MWTSTRFDFSKIKLPPLLGMIITGIVLGPYALNLIDQSVLSISSDLRQIALIIILTRAGLNLDINSLKKVGRPAILMCFLPACFEIIGMVLLAPPLLGISILDALIMGTVVAAVSPAVIVPKMLKLIETGYGKDKSIPQMIMAGASVDDVFVIVLFTSFTGLAQGESFSPISLIQVPISIILGLGLGILIGILLGFFFKKVHMRDSIKVIIILSISFLLVTLENSLKGIVPISGLIAIMSIGISLQKIRSDASKRISTKFSKLWVAAELMLFVLVGATVDIKYAFSAGIMAILLIFGVLVFRMIGVLICLIKTKLNKKRKNILYDSLLPKSNSSGSNRLYSFDNGTFLRKYSSDGCSTFNTNYCTTWSIFYRIAL